eukprot:TRINITY_DN3882_c0_g1_i3.p2 TRINITY_DN3882_c0_g1~~TRINITY_DN3882_c0_g1_i3.p2  ORF type:complete len:176 (+),score=58.70 TRINITY_DN3882_c0_g1_i3:34-561(+)
MYISRCIMLIILITLFVTVSSVCFFFFFFLMIRRPPRSTLSSSSAASDVYKRQLSGSTPSPEGVRPSINISISLVNGDGVTGECLCQDFLMHGSMVAILDDRAHVIIERVKNRAWVMRLVDLHCNTLSLIHISEPTRLLSISYAVFCLKKKKKKNKEKKTRKNKQKKKKKNIKKK